MTQIFFHQNQNIFQAITLGFVLISQKFGTLSQPGKSGLMSSEFFSKRRKGKTLMEQFSLIYAER